MFARAALSLARSRFLTTTIKFSTITLNKFKRYVLIGKTDNLEHYIINLRAINKECNNNVFVESKSLLAKIKDLPLGTQLMFPTRAQMAN